jgi:hypothetical protein
VFLAAWLQRSFVSEAGMSCEGTAFFCAGVGLPDSRPSKECLIHAP